MPFASCTATPAPICGRRNSAASFGWVAAWWDRSHPTSSAEGAEWRFRGWPRMTMRMRMNEASIGQTRAAVFGHLVGDAIGVPYEFGHHIERVELRGHGTHNQPAGTWSDDGPLMLALLDSLRSVGFDPEDQGRRALAWWDERAYTPDGDGAFDIGGATAAALHRLRAGVPAVDAGGPADSDDQGNGSLMRILPVALVDPADDDAELVRRAHLAGRVTHGATRCQVACALYVLVARILLDRPDGEPEVALALATDRLLAAYAGDAVNASVLRELLAHRSTVRKPGGGWVLDSFWSAWEAV